MKKFLDNDFLLGNDTAKMLFENHAKRQPIFDFHCHLSPKEIYEDKQFSDLAEVWLGGDHYKWRLMREMGIDEKYISGDAPSKEKFLRYAEVIPYAIGNPLYHWTHLELQRFFGINKVLSPDTAEEIWTEANKKLKTLTARKMISMSNVSALCTTDDPADSLEYHQKLSKDSTFPVKVLPAFRPDKAINIERPAFFEWLPKLEAVGGGGTIKTLPALLTALTERIAFFDSLGCVCSDHALDVVVYNSATQNDAAQIFDKALNKKPLSDGELAAYKGFLLAFLGRQYNKYGWVQQYHIGALRNASSRYMRLLGPDTGFDAVEDRSLAAPLAALLDNLDSTGELPKTILYCLNPRDNEVLAALKNCFQSAGTVAKIQFGSAWWFNDQKDGINRQLEALGQLGLISKFVGMLTDSRSFLSYPRHEYFRRILCNRLGTLIEEGEYPADMAVVGGIVEDICYHNARRYFEK